MTLRKFAARTLHCCGIAWRYLRAVSGDDAYERYLHRQAMVHSATPPMTAKAFFAERERCKWSGVTRCC